MAFHKVARSFLLFPVLLASTSSYAQLPALCSSSGYEALVTDYLGYFQLGNSSNLEPFGNTSNNGFSTSVSGPVSIVANLVQTSDSAGAIRLGPGSSMDATSTQYSSLAPAASVEFWLRVDGPLTWHNREAETMSPEVHPTIAQSGSWRLQLVTNVGQSGGSAGRLRLAKKWNTIISVGAGPYGTPPMIEVPIADFSRPHMITITELEDVAGVAPTALVRPRVYGLIVDGVDYGVITDPEPISSLVVNGINLSAISGSWCATCPVDPNRLNRADQYVYKDAPITYDEAVLYRRIVTVEEAALRYAAGTVGDQVGTLPGAGEAVFFPYRIVYSYPGSLLPEMEQRAVANLPATVRVQNANRPGYEDVTVLLNYEAGSKRADLHIDREAPGAACYALPLNIRIVGDLPNDVCDTTTPGFDHLELGYRTLQFAEPSAPQSFVITATDLDPKKGISIESVESCGAKRELQIAGLYRDATGADDVTASVDMETLVNSISLSEVEDGHKTTVVYRASAEVDRVALGGRLEGNPLTLSFEPVPPLVDLCRAKDNSCNVAWRVASPSRGSIEFFARNLDGVPQNVQLEYSQTEAGETQSANLSAAYLAADWKFVEEDERWIWFLGAPQVPLSLDLVSLDPPDTINIHNDVIDFVQDTAQQVVEALPDPPCVGDLCVPSPFEAPCIGDLCLAELLEAVCIGDFCFTPLGDMCNDTSLGTFCAPNPLHPACIGFFPCIGLAYLGASVWVHIDSRSLPFAGSFTNGKDDEEMTVDIPALSVANSRLVTLTKYFGLPPRWSRSGTITCGPGLMLTFEDVPVWPVVEELCRPD